MSMSRGTPAAPPHIGLCAHVYFERTSILAQIPFNHVRQSIHIMDANKRQKLEDLDRFRRAVPRTSASALSAIIREAKQHGLPELDSRADIREARDLPMEANTDYGPLHQVLDVDARKC